MPRKGPVHVDKQTRVYTPHKLLTIACQTGEMSYSRKILPPLVAAAVALIAVTNYCIVRLLNVADLSTKEAIAQVLAMGLPASVAVVLVMSALYQTLQETVAELDKNREQLLLKWKKDALTGITSREFFEHELKESVDQYLSSENQFSVIMLDLDNFKRINDIHGHHVGDEVLKEVASKLQSHFSSDDVVARLGGDEYVVLMKKIQQVEEVQSIADGICSALAKPHSVGTLQLRASASVGAVIARRELCSPSDYLRAADMALYAAKAQGRNCYHLFSNDLDEQLRRRDQLETDLRLAVERSLGLDVHFQPQIDAHGRVAGAEALFRWKHPLLGDIPALEAIEIAEESGLITDLGDFVFRRAAEFARTHPQLSVAMNLSPAQFTRSRDFVRRIRCLAREERVDPAQFEFEITERLFMEIGGECESQIQTLRRDGFRVALDDFGTGYSSLSYLRRFQVDRLKLDKSFAEASELNESIAIIRAAVSLAHLLGLEVIAEGIENEAHEAIALESGCDGLQGHHYGPPMAMHDFDLFMRQRPRRAA